MDFADASLTKLLQGWALSTDIDERSEAHNIHFEERLNRARLVAFEHQMTTPCVDYSHLRDELSNFVRTYVEVALPNVPATFNADVTALLLPSPEQKLVRIENITRHLANTGLKVEDLEKSLTSAKPVKSAVADMFVESWNLARDARPSFAAFRDQLITEIEDVDWPHKLRDRLGLSHFNTGGGPLDVALVEYTVEEVIEESKRSAAIVQPFTLPTFLDMKPNSQFFPVPKELPAGAPMALFEIWSDEQLIAELLHARITYRRQHIVKIGRIDTSSPLVAKQVLRNTHLSALQLASDREDFGKEL